VPRTLLRSLGQLFLGGLAALACVFPAQNAAAYSPYLVVPAPSVAEATSAYRYANMTAAEAIAELDKRKIPYKVADPIKGVVSPVRLTGKLHGVWIHSSIPESQRATSVYEVLDARLALALDDFAKILERHDIEEVVHYSLYRPNVPREDHDMKEEGAHAVAKALTADSKSGETKSAAAPVKAPGDAKPAAAPVKAPGDAKPAAAPVKAPGDAKPAAPAKAPGDAKPAAAPAKAPGLPAAASNAKSPPKEASIKGAKPAIAKLPLPQKPLPSLPAKAASGLHGAKQKTPAAIGKPAPPARAAHAAKPKTTVTAQKAPALARVRVAAPAKVAVSPKVSPSSKAPSRIEAKPATLAAKIEAKPVAAAPAKDATAAPVSRQTWAAPGTRHPAGLAIDVALLKKRDGQWISVARHFQGKIGAKTCGDNVRTADTPEARELRSIVCESNDLGVFTYVLTPNYNAAHHDHFHMEIRPTVKWFLYQ
jgi:hypothetical protein